MFHKLWEENGVPAGAFASFTAGLKKTSAPVHPQDIAMGALLGGGYAAHQAYTRHKEMPSGETPFSNKIRHELESHLETRQDTEDPSFMDRMKERLIRGKLRYANLAQGHPLAAMAAEGAAGAVGGAIGGHVAGNAIRESKALSLMKRGSALQISDILGLSRDALSKKAAALGTTIEDAAEYELLAFAISSLPTKTAGQQDFLDDMARLQNIVVGAPPSRPIKMSAAMKSAAPQGSIGQIFIEREQAKRLAAEIPSMLPEMAASQIEPNDYREPARHERGKELLGIFGGASSLTGGEKVSAVAKLKQRALQRRST
ncbi:MAG: hypothetical protein KDB07_07370 [Planctomycetes bacterium]|nr:hypothetical protein [Planctomycetota bacterium]